MKQNALIDEFLPFGWRQTTRQVCMEDSGISHSPGLLPVNTGYPFSTLRDPVGPMSGDFMTQHFIIREQSGKKSGISKDQRLGLLPCVIVDFYKADRHCDGIFLWLPSLLRLDCRYSIKRIEESIVSSDGSLGIFFTTK